MLDILVLPDRLLMGTVKEYDEIRLIGGLEPPARIFSCWHDTVLVAYEGVAQIAGRDSAEWLEDFMFQKYNLETLEQTVFELKEELQAQRIKDESINEAQHLLVYLASYEQSGEDLQLKLFCIHNHQDRASQGYHKISKYFQIENALDHDHLERVADLSDLLRDRLPEEELLWLRDGAELAELQQIDSSLRDIYANSIGQIDYWKSYLNFAMITAASYRRICQIYDKSALGTEIRSISRYKEN